MNGSSGARHAARSHRIRLGVDAATAFPLFEPIGEGRWAADWRPTFAWPADGEACVGGTFLTDHVDHEAVWVIADYDPPNRIVYVAVAPGVRASRIEVRCHADGSAGTDVDVRYDVTSLSPAGDFRLEGLEEPAFSAMIEHWLVAIERSLAGQGPTHHV